MKIQLPISVAVMDDDFFALKWNAELITRDVRTTLAFEVDSPQALLSTIEGQPPPQVLLLDTEYAPAEPDLTELLDTLRHRYPVMQVLCLSQYGSESVVKAALLGQTRGVVQKNEICMGVVSAIVAALQVNFLITPGLRHILEQGILQPSDRSNAYARQVNSINPWIPHPGLTPQLRRVFTLRVLYGMSAPMTAQEIHLAPNTVEKYMQYVYQKLSEQWGDDRYLMGYMLETLPQEVQAFHLFNLPPKENDAS